MNIGSVRLTERHGADWSSLAEDVRRHLPPLTGTRLLAVDGTTAELAGLQALRLSAIGEVLDWLRDSTEEERRARLFEPDRSEVFAAGVLIVRETLRHLELDRLEHSDRDLLNGAALAAAELPDAAEGDAPPGAYTCC